MRRLDRSRDYGSIWPSAAGRAFVQDNLIFDREGFCVEDPPDEAETGTHQNGSSNGAVSVSAPIEPAVETVPMLIPRSLSEWETMDFPKLRKMLGKAYGTRPQDRRGALELVKQHNLIAGA